MTPARHAEIRRVVAAALRWAPSERADVVTALTGDDRALAAEAHELLAHVEEPARADGPRSPDLEVSEPWPLDRVLARLAARAARAPADRPDGALDDDDDDDDDDDEPWTVTTAATRAPEELDPSLGPRGPWTTVYAEAVVAITLLRGRPPTDGVAAILARARDDDAQPTPRALGLSLPPAVAGVLERALARRPMERIQNLRRLHAQLEAARPTTAEAPRIASPRRRARWPAAIILGACLVAAVVLALALR